MTNDYEERIELLELDGIAGRYLADQALDSNEQETLLNLENHRRRLSAEMGSSRFVETCKVENPKFPIGSRVKIVNRFVDFQFFRLGETGTVIKNSGEYLGIIVLLDCPHFFKEGDDILVYWGFNYDDLILLEKNKLPEKIQGLLDNGQLNSPYWKERDQDKICW